MGVDVTRMLAECGQCIPRGASYSVFIQYKYEYDALP